MTAALDLSGQRFGRLIALDSEAGAGDGYHRVWRCRCDCGKETRVRSNNLRSGSTISCGCWRPGNPTHGGYGSPEYHSWHAMKVRCYNPRCRRYEDYGGRGIAVCERWRASFENFLADMGPRPSPRHTLDRWPDNDGNYEPANCRWATPKEQASNRRKPRRAKAA